MMTYQNIRLEFEQMLYRHDGALHLCYNPSNGDFYISLDDCNQKVLTSHGPNPWGLVEKDNGFSETTFSPEIIAFLIREEKPDDTLKAAIEHSKKYQEGSVAA
tara:strand:+ start:46727 stop:47035 length:309 start_codon:yes stop_codon:yes gene_type:complete